MSNRFGRLSREEREQLLETQDLNRRISAFRSELIEVFKRAEGGALRELLNEEELTAALRRHNLTEDDLERVGDAPTGGVVSLSFDVAPRRALWRVR